jgi:hypothetical protein
MTVTTTPPPQPVRVAQVQGGEGDELVAVDHGARPVHGQDAVAVAVEREADGVPAGHDALGERLDVRGAAAVVDVAPVGLGGEDRRLGAQAAERLGRHRWVAPLAQSSRTSRPDRSRPSKRTSSSRR